MSLSEHDSSFNILNLTKESYIARLEQAFKNPDMGAAFFKVNDTVDDVERNEPDLFLSIP